MRIALRRLLPGVLGAALGAACSAPSAPPPDDIQLKPVDDSVITAPAPEDGDESQGGPPVPRPADARAEVDATCAKAATFVVGGELETTANLNLRSGPSTSDSVIRVLALGTRVLVLAPEPVDTFVRVRHAGSDGWVSVRFVTRIGPAPMSTCADASGGGADGGVISSARSTALQIAASGVGYSFWPGNAKWPQAKPTGSSAGSCAGGVPELHARRRQRRRRGWLCGQGVASASQQFEHYCQCAPLQRR